MLREIQHIIDNPEDIPDIPVASATYLLARLNPAYMVRVGDIDALRKAGFSEGYIAGFIEGCMAATEIVDDMLYIKNRQEDDD